MDERNVADGTVLVFSQTIFCAVNSRIDLEACVFGNRMVNPDSRTMTVEISVKQSEVVLPVIAAKSECASGRKFVGVLCTTGSLIVIAVDSCCVLIKRNISIVQGELNL